MAIQFPPVVRDRIHNQAGRLLRGNSIAAQRVAVKDAVFAPKPRQALPLVLRDKFSFSLVNPVNRPVTDQRFRVNKQLGPTGARIVGVSRDSVGAILGNCTVMVFENARRVLVYETTSDASGNWSMDSMPGLGPFFYVEYLISTPDRAGTSINTNVPAVVAI